MKLSSTLFLSLFGASLINAAPLDPSFGAEKSLVGNAGKDPWSLAKKVEAVPEAAMNVLRHMWYQAMHTANPDIKESPPVGNGTAKSTKTLNKLLLDALNRSAHLVSFGRKHSPQTGDTIKTIPVPSNSPLPTDSPLETPVAETEKPGPSTGMQLDPLPPSSVLDPASTVSNGQRPSVEVDRDAKHATSDRSTQDKELLSRIPAASPVNAEVASPATHPAAGRHHGYAVPALPGSNVPSDETKVKRGFRQPHYDCLSYNPHHWDSAYWDFNHNPFCNREPPK